MVKGRRDRGLFVLASWLYRWTHKMEGEKKRIGRLYVYIYIYKVRNSSSAVRPNGERRKRRKKSKVRTAVLFQLAIQRIDTVFTAMHHSTTLVCHCQLVRWMHHSFRQRQTEEPAFYPILSSILGESLFSEECR